jgi:hypothetical protein
MIDVIARPGRYKPNAASLQKMISSSKVKNGIGSISRLIATAGLSLARSSKKCLNSGSRR